MLHFSLKNNCLYQTFIYLTIIIDSCFAFEKQSVSEMKDDEVAKLVTEQNCGNWNVNLYLGSDLKKKNILVRFEVLQEYAICFSSFEVYLYHLWSDFSMSCDPYRGRRIKRTAIVKQGNQINSALFSNLTNGNYCVLIIPCFKNVPFENWSLHSDVINMQSSATLSVTKEPVSSIISAPEVVAVAIILLLTFSIAVWMYRKYNQREWKKKSIGSKQRKKKKKALLPLDQSDLYVQELTTLPPASIDVYIFYPHVKHIQEKVMLLADFLKTCAGFKVILDEDVLDEILCNPIQWLNETLSYKCSKIDKGCDSNKRFIIVQSESTSQFFEYRSDVAEEMENEWYHYALDSISINWCKGLKDYCHLFVVCFNDAVCYDDSLMNISCGVRYTISDPDHLINLCTDMNCEFEDVSLNQLLRRRLEEQCVKYSLFLTSQSHIR